MRLINADYLCDYANNTVDKTVDANDIMRMPYIAAVPIKPLAKWLGRFTSAPTMTVHRIMDISAQNDDFTAANTQCWEEFLREMNWEGDAE